jgi:hypothetical protein
VLALGDDAINAGEVYPEKGERARENAAKIDKIGKMAKDIKHLIAIHQIQSKTILSVSRKFPIFFRSRSCLRLSILL